MQQRNRLNYRYAGSSCEMTLVGLAAVGELSAEGAAASEGLIVSKVSQKV